MPNPQSSGRSTFLGFLLILMFGAGIFLYAFLLMGPFVFAVLAIVVVIGGVGLFHYLLWGRAMNQEVETERREAGDPDEMEDIAPETNGWPHEGPYGRRRF